MSEYDIIKRSKYYQRVYSIVEILFIVLMGIYLSYRVLAITAFKLAIPSSLENVLLVAIAVVAVLRLVSASLRRRKTIIGLGLALIYCLVYLSTGYSFLLFMAALTVGCIDIDYRKLLWCWLVSVGWVYVVAVCAGILHAIPNYIRIKDGLRSSWGVCYPTDFASLGLFIVLMLWVAWSQLPGWGALLFCAGSVALSWFIAHSYTSTFCGLLLGVTIIYHDLEKHVTVARPKLRWISGMLDWLVAFSFPLCAAAMFAMMMLYARGTNIGYWINHFTSNRLEFMVSTWRQTGVSAFGTPVAMAGNGFSNFAPLNYTFVDSTYPLIMLRYGLVLFLAYCVCWGAMARMAAKTGDRRFLMAMGIIAIHSISEHHFIECNYNIMVIMPLAALHVRNCLTENGMNDSRRGMLCGELQETRRVRIIGSVIVVAGTAAALCLWGPSLLSWFKTVLEIKGLCGRETDYALIGCITGLLLIIGMMVLGSVRLIEGIIKKASVREYRCAIMALLMCGVIGGSAWIYADRTIESAVVSNAEMLDADLEALSIAISNSTKGVYSGVMPAVYGRKLLGLSYSSFFGDDLSRLRGSTVLMDAGEEYNAFFDSGFLYVRISDAHAIYTSDSKVIDALSKADYHLTGFYNTPQTVDMAEAAQENDLQYSPKNGALLKGPRQSLKKGPYVDLYAGSYTVTYDLKLPKNASESDGIVCVLSVTSYKGKVVLLEKEIRRDQFDKKRRLTVSIPFKIEDSQNVAFRVRTRKGKKVYVRQIEYVRTPDYDMHALYDEKLRMVRQEYYSLDGNRILGPQGYSSVEYGYDNNNNITLVRYFNAENEPVLHTSGYAEMRRTFNANRQIVREEYYGTDGQPIALMNGAAMNVREYDAKGNAIVNRYFGIDNQPVLIKSGYAEVRRQFNEDRQVIREAYYGIDGEPVALPTGEYAAEMEYDEAGDISVKRFYGAHGERVNTVDGYSEAHWQYNRMHQLTHVEFYDEEGAPTLNIYGEASNEREYDEAGNIIEFRCYGLDGMPVLNKGGYAQKKSVFNDRRQVIREAYYGVDGQPIALSENQCAVEYAYDDAGNVSIQRYYGADGLPVMGKKGYAEVHWEYNSMRQIVREAFYGTDGALIEVSDGSAINERDYDAHGNVSACRYYDAAAKPVVTIYGYVSVRRDYNDQRQVVREAYYDAEGLPMAQPGGYCSVDQAYDEWGNIVLQKYYDENHMPVAASEGYAELRRVYNSNRLMLREAYYDVNGAPYVRAAGHAAIQQEFDDSGKLAVRRYLDASGEMMQRVDGYSEARWYSDENGVRYVAFYDLKGNEVPIDGLNLTMDAPDAYSRWYMPQIDSENRYEAFSSATLGKKQVGDQYTIQLEIEFRNVEGIAEKRFLMRALGAMDGEWGQKNIWNSELVNLIDVPQDDVYQFSITQSLDEAQAQTGVFNLGFCCEHWAQGQYRLRHVKVERGSQGTAWSPGI